jgi:hypothetical protein
MAGPWCDHELIAGFERGLALTLETQAVLLDVMRNSLTPMTPQKSLRSCLAAVSATLRLTDRVDRRPALFPDDDPPEAVRTDAELRALARALREQAERLAADLTRLLRTPCKRRRSIPRLEPPIHRPAETMSYLTTRAQA